jgi:hypothetical protein
MKKLFTIVLIVLTGYSFLQGATLNVPSGYSTIQAAVTASNPGDIINIASGTIVLTEQVSVNKANLTIQGQGSGSTILQVSKFSGTNYGFLVTASGVTIRELQIQKTDKTGENDIVGVQGSNFTFQNNIVQGQFVVPDGDVSRALEVSGGLTGILIDGNKLFNLRQPGYLNPSTITISNNLVYGTKGWVIAGANVTFTGNQWATGAQAKNYWDIAILVGTNALYYPNLITLSNANFGAMIEDGRLDPAPRSHNITFVNASSSGDGSPLNPFQTIAAAIAATVAGGTVNVSAGIYNEHNININNALTLNGANKDVPSGSRGSESRIQDILPGTGSALINTLSDGITINGFELTAPMANNAIYCGENGPSNLNIKFNYFHDITTSRGSGTGYAINYRVNAPSTTNVNISDNIFNEVFNTTSLKGSAAIWLGQSTANGTVSNLTIERNTISNVKSGTGQDASGIYIGVAWGTGTGKVQSPVIGNNTITDIQGGVAYAIQLSGKTPGAVVSNNIVNNIINLSSPSTAAFGVAIPSTNTGSATISVNNNSFTNVLYGIVNGTVNTVDATYNWWGDASGPYDPKTTPNTPNYNNPLGLGSAVTPYVAYNPWYNDASLPVELSSFTSVINGRNVQLSWGTKTEKNSNKFDVEKMNTAIGSSWVNVGSVKAAVLSNSPKQYSFTDKNLQAGKYQYRLKMIDNDGSFEYSKIVETEVATPKNFELSQNYPNPFNPSTRIDYQVPVDAKVILEVYNIAGQKVSELVNQEQSAGYYTVDFGSSKLSSGVYIYRIVASDKATGNNFSSIKKMMLLK